MQKPLNLAVNPLKNQAKRKVWKSKILRKPPNLVGNPVFDVGAETQILWKPLNLPGNPLKYQAKRKVWKSQILRKLPNLAGNPFKKSSQTKSMKISNFAKTSKFGCKSF